MTDATTVETPTKRPRPPITRSMPSNEELRRIYTEGEVDEKTGRTTHPSMETLAQRYSVSRARISAAIGGVRTRSKSETRRAEYHVRQTPDNLRRLKEIALEYGFRTMSGTRPGEGSINDLLEAVARGRLSITRVADHHPRGGPQGPVGIVDSDAEAIASELEEAGLGPYGNFRAVSKKKMVYRVLFPLSDEQVEKLASIDEGSDGKLVKAMAGDPDSEAVVERIKAVAAATI